MRPGVPHACCEGYRYDVINHRPTKVDSNALEDKFSQIQGHDHIFAKQELDGVIYQSCPVPADATNELMNGDAYISGDKLVGAGLVRVSVNPEKSKIEFLRSFQPAAEVDGHKHGEIAYSYEVKPRSKS